MADEEFSIQELSDRTGLPRRTIHFYIQQGILPPPIGSGLGARYQKEHLVRLQLIPILRQQGLRLDDIREKFSQANPTQWEQMARSIQETPEPPKPAPAAPHQGGAAYTIYTLADGVLVMIPNQLPPETRSKAHQLLQAAQLLFSNHSSKV